jgi:zinc protease
MLLFKVLPKLTLIIMFLTVPKINSQVNIEFEEYDLLNGLHVILNQDKTNPIICVDIWYHVGSKNEDTNKTGFAHLFEHMMFQGSENVGKTEHFKYVQDAGGTLNGSTTQDRTNYFETLPSNKLEIALWLESDRMSTLKVTQDNFDNQREVVKEEKRQRYDNVPYGSRFDYLFKLSYKEHPYHWITIGSMEDLNNAELEYAKRFYRKFYCPDNAVLTIVGDIDIQETKTLVNKYFGSLKPAGKIKRDYPPDIFHKGEVIDTIYENVQLPAIYIGYKIPPVTSKENRAFELLSIILSNGRSSRLYKNIVYEKELSKSINAFNYDLELGGIFLISSNGLPNSDLYKIQTQVDSIIENLRDENVTDWELEKAKNNYETGYVNRTQTVLGKAELLEHFRTFFNNTSLINKNLDYIQQVSSDDIKSAAKQFLTKDNRVVLYYLPKNSQKN